MTIETEISTELVVFDFDETIVNCNSDTYINQLAPGGVIPKQIWNTFQNDHDWTIYMQQVFAYLHENGTQESDYKECLSKMPFVDALQPLLQNLAEGTDHTRFEMIIISDANSFFIGHALETHKFKHLFSKVFTNPAFFDENGCLQIEKFHDQNWCNLSARNLCKGHVMKDYIGKRASESVNFKRINYVGDGSNDLCPALKLSANDRIFPRLDYPLHKLVSSKMDSREFAAQVFPFVTGNDIWKVIGHS